MLSLSAKQHGIDDVIAKVSHENYMGLVEKMGVDMVLNPLDISASNILRYIQGSKRVLSSFLIQGQAQIMEVVANSKMRLIGKPLKELDLPKEILFVAIKRGDRVIIPNGETTIKLNDRLTIFTLLSGLSKVEKLMKTKNR